MPHTPVPVQRLTRGARAPGHMLIHVPPAASDSPERAPRGVPTILVRPLESEGAVSAGSTPTPHP